MISFFIYSDRNYPTQVEYCIYSVKVIQQKHKKNLAMRGFFVLVKCYGLRRARRALESNLPFMRLEMTPCCLRRLSAVRTHCLY